MSGHDDSTAPSAFNRLKECRHGPMLYNIHDEFVGRSLDLYGEFSEGEVDLFKQLIETNDVVLDVGANIGAHTIPLAKAVGRNGVVAAFEPQNMVFQTLCANVALNNLTNVLCFQAAAGEAPGTLRVPVLDPYVPNNFGGLALGGAEIGLPVPVIRLDTLAIPRCDLIKVDVEGMERQVLIGAAGLIQRFQPALYVENDREELRDDLIRCIDAMGYAAYWHVPPLFNPNNFLANHENVFPNLASFNMLCVPKSETVHIAGATPVIVPPP